jgi:hypothetical protein
LNRLHLFFLSGLLAFVGLGLFAYKALWLKFPLSQDTEANSWLVETKMAFYAGSRPIKLNLTLPSNKDKFIIVDENFISRGYGLTTQISEENRNATWSIRRAEGGQNLYYRAVIQENENPVESSSASGKAKKVVVDAPTYEGAELEAATALITELKEKSADTDSLTRSIFKALNRRAPNENAALLLGRNQSNLNKTETARRLLAIVGVPSRVVQGVRLLEQTSNAEIEPILEVWDENTWKSYDPISGSSELPANYLRWWYGSEPLAKIKGADRLRTEVGIKRYEEDALVHALAVGKYSSPLLLDFSLFSLPIEAQGVYKVLLLVPIGAFIIVVLRNLIGIVGFGTFMPVLIALSFRETQLLGGIILFSILIACGLLVRFYLDHLKLLLVPRLASILTVVVLMMAIMSIITHRLGLGMGLSVALFPMVILTLTIERMCITWDELGPWSALKQCFNTLVTASAIFIVISSKALEHIIFVFPELILVVLALTILMGRYTGYRLFELTRFRDLAEKK